MEAFMFLIRDDLMYPLGYVTVFFYLASVMIFFFGLFISVFFTMGMVLTILFFAIASIILGVMVKQRIES